jgi:hypothetical protein
MVKAKTKHTTKSNWSLSDLHRYLCVELDYEADAAVHEMWKAIAANRLDLMVQAFVQPRPGPYMPQGDPVKLDPYDFRINYALKFVNTKTIEVVCEKLDYQMWKGETFLGFVQRVYTIDEQAARRLWQRPSTAETAAEQQLPGHPPMPRSKNQQTLWKAVVKTFPNGCADFSTRQIIKKASAQPEVKALDPQPERNTWLRALSRREG